MADITISDLELAPALTDDMVLPVENTTDTYAATLAMLRRLINKTFVEVENADFNALTDDGFYQCTGTPTNSPVAGAINWTLQVSAENGVVVQRAFSLDDNFANLYIRRWNGVTWTAWLEVGAGALDNKANISLSNLDATGQAKFVEKVNRNADNFTDLGSRTIGYINNPRYDITMDLPTDGTMTILDKCGFIRASAEAFNNNQAIIELNNIQIRIAQSNNANYSTYGTIFIRTNETNNIRFISGNNRILKFYPLSSYVL